MIWTAAYVASVVLVNVIFGWVPFLGSFVVGGIFIVRDLAQREIGHRVALATLAGIGISYVMAAPPVAVASACAFGIGGGADWLVFSALKRHSFRRRVVMSSLVSVPIDSAVFLGVLLGTVPAAAFWVQVASKLAAVAVILAIPRPVPEVA
jgi:uncharacterized PurR-regulated membrane protein YhhQ (DUF165 family)